MIEKAINSSEDKIYDYNFALDPNDDRPMAYNNLEATSDRSANFSASEAVARAICEWLDRRVPTHD